MGESKAKLSYAFIGSQKLLRVAELVRGKKVQDAINILKFTHKKAAKLVSKTLHSAISNADQKGNIDIENLYVKKINVGPGMMHYRVTPRAKGSAAYIRKKTSHLTVELEEK